MTNNSKEIKNKGDQLEELSKQILSNDDSPLFNYRKENNYLPVFGEGNPEAKILFIGEAPGLQEAKTGRPFIGRAGKHLDSLLVSIGLSRKDVYITNIVKDRPPSNRDPHAEEIKFYAPILQAQIEIIQPKVIVTLGRFAMEFIINFFDLPCKGKKIGEIHGMVIQISTKFGYLKIIPMYHPAAIFYNRNLESTLNDDFEKLKLLGD